MLEEDLSPVCDVCGEVASTIKLVYDGKTVELIIEGICAGGGGSISQKRADKVRAAFALPHTAEKMALSGLDNDGGFCKECSKFYCYTHWNVTSTGGGWCPEGHLKILDPYGWPGDDD